MKQNAKTSKINKVIETIISKRPHLKHLATDKSVLEYLRSAIEWKQNKEIFPYAELLSEIVTGEIKRLYGEVWANEAKIQLKDSWVIETGAHLNIPRRFNKASVEESSHINSLLVQGQILWGMANHALGRRISLGLNSGRVPADNTNSGAYLDIPALKQPITLVSRKKHPDSPQTLIPARTVEEIQEKIDLLNMYLKQKLLPVEQYNLGLEVLNNFLLVRSSFSDQVATSHALMLDKVVPTKQLTLDSEPIGKELFLRLIKDPNSLIYKIFSSKALTKKFLECFADIRTGWPKDGMPFFFVRKEEEGTRLIFYKGDLKRETIIKGLEENTMFLTGVMKFFTLMVEAGILPVGGWTQAGYCTEIRDQAVKFLRDLNLEDRAQALETMPTYITAVAACWGLDETAKSLQLLDPITLMLDPQAVDYSTITELTGNQVLLIAAPTLYEFLKDEEALSIQYAEVKDLLKFAVTKRKNVAYPTVSTISTLKKIPVNVLLSGAI